MITLLGKNGSGKTFIANQLVERGYTRIPSYTTREPREGEINGRDYHFISKEEFTKLLKKDFFVEYKKRNDHYYGISLINQDINSILVGGNIKLINNHLDEKIIPIYIDTDINERFRRVSLRNDSSDIIDRFHSENFSFLDDFKGIFLDNNELNNDAFSEIEGVILNNQINLKNNFEFIYEKVNSFSINEVEISENPLLAFLKYEEYLLRSAVVEGNCSLEYYMDNIIEFLTKNGIKYNENKEGFFINNQFIKKENEKIKLLRSEMK